MKLLFIVLGLLVLGVLAYWSILFYQKAGVAKELTRNATPYQREGDERVSLLVLGDSTAVGVGASAPEDSVAGRLATHIGATYVENHAKSGAVIADLGEQMRAAQLSEYDTILIQIGGNNIIRFEGAARAGEELTSVLDILPQSNRTIVMTAGNVGGASFFPPPLRPFYTRLNLQYHEVFQSVSDAHGAIYVNLYEPPETDPFLKERERYLSEDGLHPSSEGYRLWFERVRDAL